MIEFSPLLVSHGNGVGEQALVLRPGGAGGLSAGFGFGGARITLRPVGDGYGYAAGDLEPQVPASGFTQIFIRPAGEGYGAGFGEGAATIRLEPWGAGVKAGFGAGSAALQLRPAGAELTSVGGTAYLVGRMPLVSSLGAHWYMTVTETVAIQSAWRSLPIYGIDDGIDLGGSGIATLAGLAHARENIEFGDALAVVLRELLAEGFEFGGAAAYNYTAIARIADGLLLAGVAGSQLEAMNIVAAAIAFGELLRQRAIEGVTDSVLLADAVADAAKLGARLVESLLVEAADAPAVLFGMLVREDFTLAANGTSILQAVELLREGVSFTLHLNIDDGQYMAYVINTESKAVSQYANYPFNSFARVGGRYFGMTPDGIRELEGPDDAGSPIAARFRMAMSNLGYGQMKRMIAAYLGYTSTGELRLKTITVDVNGVKQAHHYRLLAQLATAPREARVKIGQGLRSVYWGFEVEAIDGAAFMIDVLDLQPIVVEQRIQGQGGGKR